MIIISPQQNNLNHKKSRHTFLISNYSHFKIDEIKVILFALKMNQPLLARSSCVNYVLCFTVYQCKCLCLESVFLWQKAQHYASFITKKMRWLVSRYRVGRAHRQKAIGCLKSAFMKSWFALESFIIFQNGVLFM